MRGIYVYIVTVRLPIVLHFLCTWLRTSQFLRNFESKLFACFLSATTIEDFATYLGFQRFLVSSPLNSKPRGRQVHEDLRGTFPRRAKVIAPFLREETVDLARPREDLKSIGRQTSISPRRGFGDPIQGKYYLGPYTICTTNELTSFQEVRWMLDRRIEYCNCI